MGWGWLPLLWGGVLVALVLLLQLKTRHFIRALETDQMLYQQAGRPSRDYFWVGLLQWQDHGLLNWVIRHPCLPAHLAAAVPDYADIRALCRLYRWLLRIFLGGLLACFLLSLGWAFLA